MKNILLLAFLFVSFGFYSCSDTSSSKTKPDELLTSVNRMLDSIKVDSTRRDSLAKAFKNSENIAYGNIKFGMNKKQYDKIMPSSFKMIGEYGYYLHPQFTNNDQLYLLEIESQGENASFFDSDIKPQMQNLYDIIHEKYKKPTDEFGGPNFLESEPGYALWVYKWEIGSKIIKVGINEDYSGARYHAVCHIYDSKIYDKVNSVNENEIEAKKKQDASDF